MLLIEMTLLSKEECHLCHDALELLKRCQALYPISLKVVDIAEEEALYDQFKEEIPVLFVEGKKMFIHRIDENALKKHLEKLLKEKQEA